MIIALLVMGAAGLIDHFVLGDVLLDNVLGGVGEWVVTGIAYVIDGIVWIFGTIFFWVANTTIDWAMKLNGLLAGSPVVQEGFNITLSIANLGLVVGFIVMAIAIMIRAEWMVETRKSIPKFITAALLINFGFFILVDLMIKPVDGIFKNIYDAAHINMDTFRGTLSPNLDIMSVAQVQMRIAKIPADNQPFANKTLLYSTLLETRIGPGVDALLKYYETGAYIQYADARNYASFTPGANNFNCISPIGQEVVVVDASGTKRLVPVYVTEAQRDSVSERITHQFTWFLEDMNDGNYARDLFTSPPGWGNGNEQIDQYFDDFGAPYKTCSPNNLDALKDAIAKFMSHELEKGYNPDLIATANTAGNDTAWGMGCRVWDESSGDPVYDGNNDCICGANSNDYDAQPCISNIAWNLLTDLNNLEKITIMLLETLFNFIFTLLGAFTLLGVGLMLIYRYVVLSFLIILFPFVWLGWIFPKIATMGGGKNIWTAWWGQFLRWLLFGPIAMFFIYLSAKAAIGISTLTTPPGEAFVGKGSMAVLAASVGNAAVVIGLLIGGTYVAQKMGIAGSGMIMGTIKGSPKWLGKMTTKYGGRGYSRLMRTQPAQSLLGGVEKAKMPRVLGRLGGDLVTGGAARMKAHGTVGGRERVAEWEKKLANKTWEELEFIYPSLSKLGKMAVQKRRVDENKAFPGGGSGELMMADYSRWFKTPEPKGLRPEPTPEGGWGSMTDDEKEEWKRDSAHWQTWSKEKEEAMEYTDRDSHAGRFGLATTVKKGRKEGLDADQTRLLRELVRAMKSNREADATRLGGELEASIRRSLRGVTDAQAALWIKQLGGWVKGFKTNPEQQTMGVDDPRAHKRVGEILTRAVATEKAVGITRAKPYMDSAQKEAFAAALSQQASHTQGAILSSLRGFGTLPKGLETGIANMHTDTRDNRAKTTQQFKGFAESIEASLQRGEAAGSVTKEQADAVRARLRYTGSQVGRLNEQVESQRGLTDTLVGSMFSGSPT